MEFYRKATPITEMLLNDRAQRSIKAGFTKQKWVEFCEALIGRYELKLYEAKTTFSKYIYILKPGTRPYKVRFSNHKPNKQREKLQDCDFFVGVTHYGVTTTKDALKAVEEHFKSLKGEAFHG